MMLCAYSFHICICIPSLIVQFWIYLQVPLLGACIEYTTPVTNMPLFSYPCQRATKCKLPSTSEYRVIIIQYTKWYESLMQFQSRKELCWLNSLLSYQYSSYYLYNNQCHFLSAFVQRSVWWKLSSLNNVKQSKTVGLKQLTTMPNFCQEDVDSAREAVDFTVSCLLFCPPRVTN